MTIEYYDTKAPAWEECSLYQRLQDCRTMLHLHGLLTDHENFSVKARIKKALVKQEEADVKAKEKNMLH